MEGRFSRTRRPSAPPAEFFTTARSMLEQAQARNAEVLEASRAFKGHTYSNSIYYLEPWSMPGFAQREETAVASGMAMLKAKIDRGEIPGIVKGQGRIFVKKRRWEFPIPGAGELRERRPDYVPVRMPPRQTCFSSLPCIHSVDILHVYNMFQIEPSCRSLWRKMQGVMAFLALA
ncbi:unnamed protein product [Malus baccata var. baccata]